MNDLTPAELERLVVLHEELNEAAHMICKIIRHGYCSYHPDDPEQVTNRENLERELGDVMFCISLLCSCDDTDMQEILKSSRQKAVNIQKWLHHNQIQQP